MSSAAAGFSSSDASVYEIELFLRIDKDAFGANLFAVFKTAIPIWQMRRILAFAVSASIATNSCISPYCQTVVGSFLEGRASSRPKLAGAETFGS
ncbi:hypothetical protein GCM10010136_31220 [Limoniibacter endophyticus]|uniref:Uncharacterized protein n=1 Tax=Limoniibacter endophyticus TaxID=1565040 RepID=A0A8J3GIJ8_9HYPH|nr:hypothetical protein GCM10010136_31220 [Limoniibacter endophyticus]